VTLKRREPPRWTRRCNVTRLAAWLLVFGAKFHLLARKTTVLIGPEMKRDSLCVSGETVPPAGQTNKDL